MTVYFFGSLYKFPLSHKHVIQSDSDGSRDERSEGSTFSKVLSFDCRSLGNKFASFEVLSTNLEISVGVLRTIGRANPALGYAFL
jgi:hypothetical protein